MAIEEMGQKGARWEKMVYNHVVNLWSSLPGMILKEDQTISWWRQSVAASHWTFMSRDINFTDRGTTVVVGCSLWLLLCGYPGASFGPLRVQNAGKDGALIICTLGWGGGLWWRKKGGHTTMPYSRSPLEKKNTPTHSKLVWVDCTCQRTLLSNEYLETPNWA